MAAVESDQKGVDVFPEDGSVNANNSLNDPLLGVSPNQASDAVQSPITASPSVASLSSSIVAQMKLDEDFLLESKDLMIRVDNPEKHSNAIESYITFRVITKTTRSCYDSHEYCVRRRYNDFIWLRNKLEEIYPTHLVPPLPEKHSMQRLNRFNVDFIKTRMLALNKFLARVSDHPVLSFDKNLQLFLVAKPFEFAAHKKEGLNILGRVSNTFHNIAATYMMKLRAPEFDQMNDYITKFSEKLGTIERISLRINREQNDYISELKEFHPVFTLWSSSENKLNRALISVSSAVETMAKAQQVVTSSYNDEFARPIREYILYADSIKDALKRRDAMQIEYELTVEELNNRKLEKEQLKTGNQHYAIRSLLGQNSEDLKKDRLMKIDLIIESLVQQTESTNDKLECANANLVSDFERWQLTKREDLKSIFVTLANRQIEFYQKCLSAWEEAIPLIRDTDIDCDISLSEKLNDLLSD